MYTADLIGELAGTRTRIR